MSEERKLSSEKEPVNIFRRRNLTSGGTLFVVDQGHTLNDKLAEIFPAATDYNRPVISEDFKTINPDVLIMENMQPLGKEMASSTSVNSDMEHQFFLAKSANIPVVFPDILLRAQPTADVFLKIVDYEEIAVNNQTQQAQLYYYAVATAILGLTFLKTLGVKATASWIKKKPLDLYLSRREFLAAVLGVGVGTGLFAVPLIGSDLRGRFKMENLRTSGDLEKDVPAKVRDQIKHVIDNLLILGERSRVLPVMIEGRNAKFVETAEMCSLWLQATGKKAPRVAAVLGEAHGADIVDSQKYDGRTRAAIINAIIRENFLKKYLEVSKLATSPQARDVLLAAATLSLTSLSLAGVYKVDEKSNKVDGKAYLISDSFVQSIRAALESDKDLATSYDKKMEEINRSPLAKHF